MGNEIQVYQGNTNTITCTVTGLDDLIEYTATLTVKKDIRDLTTLIEVDGDIAGLIIVFETTAVQNTLPTGRYVYDVTITDDTKVFTVVKDEYIINDSVKY